MKKGIALLVVLLVVLSVSSFAMAKVQIQYWHAMSGLLGSAIDAQVDLFNASQDRIHVEVEYKGSYRDTLNATTAALRTGTAPHVIQSFEISTQQLIDMGLFLPLEDAFPPGTVDWDKFLAPVVDYYRVDGKLWSMPYNSSNAILYYNKDIFVKAGLDPEKPPTTFEEVIEYSQQIMDSGAARHGIVWPLHTWFFEQWMANMGANLVDKDNGRTGRATTVLLEQDQASTILNWWKGLYETEMWVNPGVENWSQSRQIFAAQQAGMAIDSTAALSAKMNAGKEHGFGVGTGYIPISEDYERHGVVIGGGSLWVLGVHNDEETEAAGELVQFLSSAAVQAEWHKGTGYFPVHEDSLAILAEEKWFENNPGYKTAMDQLLESKPITATQGARMGNFPEVRTIITDAIQEVMQGQKTVEVALRDAKVRAESAMAEYNRVIGN